MTRDVIITSIEAHMVEAPKKDIRTSSVLYWEVKFNMKTLVDGLVIELKGELHWLKDPHPTTILEFLDEMIIK